MGERLAQAEDPTRGQQLAAAKRSRSGHRPEDARTLSTAERLTVAAFDLLSRDMGWQSRLTRLASQRPACSLVLRPARAAIGHLSWEPHGGHAACRDWLRDLVAFGQDIGCPSLDALLGQFEIRDGLAAEGFAYRFGSIVAHRLIVDATRPPRSRLGVIDRPAFLLLTRKWRDERGTRATHRTLVEVAGTWLDHLDAWLRDELPNRRGITYPAWREWSGRRRSREALLLPPSQRAEAVARWARGGAAADGQETSQAIRKGHARIGRILRASLPVIPEAEALGRPTIGRMGR